jgi:hypothetical protein
MSNPSETLPLTGVPTIKDGDNAELTPTHTKKAKKAVLEDFFKPCSKSKKIKIQMR